IGFILYFQVREPLPYPCPRCSTMVGARFNFCPNCKCNLHPSCPNCKREVAETDKFCPYCAQDLTAKQEAGSVVARSTEGNPSTAVLRTFGIYPRSVRPRGLQRCRRRGTE